MTRPGVALSLLAVGAALSGCQSHVKGSWACAVDRGGVCASISDIDHMPARGGAQARTASTAPDPVLDGAIPARLWGEGGWTAGPLTGAPVRQSDQVMKVAVAPWVDQAGDYHAGSEVYAVMRRSGWYAPNPSLSRRVELSLRHASEPRLLGAPSRQGTGPARTYTTARSSGQPQLLGAPSPGSR